MYRTCDGTDPELLQMTDIDGRPTADELFAIEINPCPCGSIFNDLYHELVWPHDYVPPAGPLISDLPNLMGLF